MGGENFKARNGKKQMKSWIQEAAKMAILEEPTAHLPRDLLSVYHFPG